jgi:hypothetical protein
MLRRRLQPLSGSMAHLQPRPRVLMRDRLTEQREALRQAANDQTLTRPDGALSAYDRKGQERSDPSDVYPVRMVSVKIIIPGVAVAQGFGMGLALRENPFRKGLIVSNTTLVTVFLSFSSDDRDGIPIPAATVYEWKTGTVPIDPVYIRHINAASQTLRIYEAVALPNVLGAP